MTQTKSPLHLTETNNVIDEVAGKRLPKVANFEVVYDDGEVPEKLTQVVFYER
jgi:hypothetical protein